MQVRSSWLDHRGVCPKTYIDDVILGVDMNGYVSVEIAQHAVLVNKTERENQNTSTVGRSPARPYLSGTQVGTVAQWVRQHGLISRVLRVTAPRRVVDAGWSALHSQRMLLIPARWDELDRAVARRGEAGTELGLGLGFWFCSSGRDCLHGLQRCSRHAPRAWGMGA